MPRMKTVRHTPVGPIEFSEPALNPTTRYAHVVFTKGPLGLVTADDPDRWIEHVALEGEHGQLIVEGELPFEIPDGWVLVKVGSFYCPTHPDWIRVEERPAS